MVKPTKYKDARSLACPKCGYRLVAPPREPDLLCPECGLRFPIAAAPPNWSIEIGPFIHPGSLAKTLALSFFPRHIVNAVLRPRSITRPLRTLLIPILALALLHTFIFFLTVATTAGSPVSPLWPYDSSHTTHLLTRMPAHILFLVMLLTILTLSAWIAIAFSFGFASGKRRVIGLRLWAYAVPHIALASALWMLARAILINLYDPRHPDANLDAIFSLTILGSYIALAILFLLVGGLWWGFMAAAMSAKGQE